MCDRSKPNDGSNQIDARINRNRIMAHLSDHLQRFLLFLQREHSAQDASTIMRAARDQDRNVAHSYREHEVRTGTSHTAATNAHFWLVLSMLMISLLRL
jgi:ABC-type Zn2+ transport system substrate-binding protein/surface adhesin